MDLKRFFTEQPIDEYAYLTGDEFLHAVKVVRLKIGYKLIVCENSAYDYYCTVTEIAKDKLTAKVDKKIKNETEYPFNITLFIGANKELDTVVQKAVEMGVNKIVPFTSQHCNLDKINKQRLMAIVKESSKQCGRSVLAEIGDLIRFEDILPTGKVYAFYEFETKNKLPKSPIREDVSIIIGCEGGFSLEEAEMMREKGYSVLTLGKRILRVSTAVVCALALIGDRTEKL